MRKGFTIVTESWWYRGFDHRSMTEEIMIGDYPEEGGTKGEFNVRFYAFAKGPKLEIFYDAFDVYGQMEDFREFLFAKENRNIGRDAFIQGLKDLGFIDLTQRKR